MAKHWAIAIGINTYSSFQTLRYAQNDAEGFCRELIESGRVTPDSCLLMTTASALHLGQSTFPLRTTLLQWFQWLVDEALQPEDQLWVFFSGYGIHAEGHDYLMPIDGDPKQPQTTGISLARLFQLLQEAPTDRILMLLDMNHNEGSLATPVGIQTARLAQQTGIATLQSCQPQKGEFSRKAAGLNHGFFTAALLPALRNPELRSLKSLSQDLDRRMEELSEHYWRPEQTPLTVGEFMFDSLESIAEANAAGNAVMNGGRDTSDASLFAGSSEASVTPLDVNYVPSTSTTGLGDQFASTWNWAETEASEVATVAGEEDSKAEIDPYAAVWEENHGQILDESEVNQNYGGVTLNPPENGSATSADDGMDGAAEGSASDSVQGDNGQGDNGQGDNKAGASSWHWPDWVVAPAQGGTGTESASDVVTVNNGHHNGQITYPEPPPVVPESEPGFTGPELPGPDLAAASQGSVENADLVPEFSGNGSAAVGTVPDSLEPDDSEDVSLDNAPLDIDREGGAGLIAVQPGLPGPETFPEDANQTIDVEPLRPAEGGYSVYSEELNGDFDDDGGLPIIELDPLEPEESENGAIADSESKGGLPGWFNLKLLGATGLVLLTALGLLGWFRTRDRNFAQDSAQDSVSTRQDGATPIQPATTSPTASGTELSEGAGNASSDESGSESSDDLNNAEPATIQSNAPSAQLLQQAQANLQPSQASSYNQAISTARTIPSSDPNYKAARQQMDGWSQEMMTLADQRAETGDYLGAIAAARLVPPDLLTFPDAQGSIAQWQAPAQLQHAKALVKPGLASSYNQAIAVARGIPAGIPASAEAEQLRQAWSREILTIAEARAQRGQWVLAIAAAQLVPSDMDAFADAQNSIAQWQTQTP